MYLKNSKVSVSCILFFCITIFISSIHKTAVMIKPAIGIMTLSLILLIKLNTSEFHPIGVFPISVATAPTLSLMSINIDSRFAWIPPRRSSLKNSSILSKIPNIGYSPYFNTFESNGISFKPIRTMPPPAINCFMPN
ncbi:Uncharacterised protein [Chlamydia trachomatis]|nr:Uncharacterised protein [Chlamydia trachomatis]